MVRRWLRRDHGGFPSDEYRVSSFSRESCSSGDVTAEPPDMEAAAPHSSEESSLDTRTEQLAFAWWLARRKHTSSSQRRQTGAVNSQEGQDRIPYVQPRSNVRSSSPVDVDNVLNDNHREEDPKMIISAAVFDDCVSSTSFTPSESTPVISNRKYYSTDTYAGSCHSQHTDGNNTVMLDGIREVPSRESSEEFSQILSTTGGFFDWYSPQGRMAILLLIIFCLTLGTITVSIVSGIRANKPSNHQYPRLVPSEFTEMPSRSPIQVPAPHTPDSATDEMPVLGAPSVKPSSPVPVVLLNENTESPITSFPTTGPPTLLPTSAPSESFQNIKLGSKSTLAGTVGEAFGQSVALSDDGNVLVVGSPQASVGDLIQAGRVVVYQKDKDTWRVRDEILGTVAENSMGSAVAVSSDGSRVAVSEPTDGTSSDKAGRVQVYNFDGSQYIPMGLPLLGPGPVAYFGVSIAIDNDRLAIGAPYHSELPFRFQGQVGVYEWDFENWAPIGVFNGRGNLDWLGSAVGLKGDVLVSSAPRSAKDRGYVRAWQRVGFNEWAILGDEIVNDVFPATSNNRFGDSVSLSSSGKSMRVAVGIPWKSIGREINAGMVVVYELDTDLQWRQLGDPIRSEKPKANEEVGSAVSLDDSLLAVGAPGAEGGTGTVSLYRFNGETWERYEGMDLVGRDTGSTFGISLSIVRSQSTLPLSVAVGASAMGKGFPGSVHVFSDDSQPSDTPKIKGKRPNTLRL